MLATSQTHKVLLRWKLLPWLFRYRLLVLIIRLNDWPHIAAHMKQNWGSQPGPAGFLSPGQSLVFGLISGYVWFTKNMQGISFLCVTRRKLGKHVKRRETQRVWKATGEQRGPGPLASVPVVCSGEHWPLIGLTEGKRRGGRFQSS